MSDIFIDGEINDPETCPSSIDGKCPDCNIEVLPHYGFAGGYGLGISSYCPNCYKIYDFIPER